MAVTPQQDRGAVTNRFLNQCRKSPFFRFFDREVGLFDFRSIVVRCIVALDGWREAVRKSFLSRNHHAGCQRQRAHSGYASQQRPEWQDAASVAKRQFDVTPRKPRQPKTHHHHQYSHEQWAVDSREPIMRKYPDRPVPQVERIRDEPNKNHRPE
jgi:hypothetical protein